MNILITKTFVACFVALITFTTAGAEESKTRLRIVSANLSSGNRQSYDNGEGARILKGLKADIVLIQEFNYGSNSKEDLQKFVESACGKECQFYRENEASDDIPNGVISRFPILEAGEWEDLGMPNRDFAWARIDLPGDRDLWAISVHLSSKKANVRVDEATTLVEKIAALPARDYVVLGGDFNIAARNDAVIQTLAPQVSERAAPVTSSGATTTNMNGKKNYDWVLNDSDLEAFRAPTEFLTSRDELQTIGQNVFPTGLVFDCSEFPTFDRAAPAEPTDCRAPGMQHLAVVKDYEVPSANDGTTAPPTTEPTPQKPTEPAPTPSQPTEPTPTPSKPTDTAEPPKTEPVPPSPKRGLSVWPRRK
jgi:endonuclease/exonuclease/phosphatase family metal-dependent hydrolase